MTATLRVRCPVKDNEPGPNGTVVGCGYEWDVPLATLNDDPDGWVDCPKCGLGFDPKHPNSQPQPGGDT